MIAGYVYDYLKVQNYNLKKSKTFLFLWIASIFGLLYVLILFYWSIDIPKPSLLVAVFGGFIPILWASFASIVLLGLAFKFGGRILTVFNNVMFLVLGRVSFAAYMVHMFFMRMAFAFVKKEIHVNTFQMISTYVGIVSLSYLAALVLSLLIELPISSLMKNIIIEKEN
uniref:Acyltransferase 3 domain-containing protein n=1 Tax=Megaselia scalaris TaxID=36166 RepID=T1GS59_MEGSC